MLDRAKRGREPWLLIKKSDEAARPTQEHDVIAAEPDRCCSSFAPAPGQFDAAVAATRNGPAGGTPFAPNRAQPHEVGNRRADGHT